MHAAFPWPEPVKALSGRIHVELETINSAVRHAVYLEMRNHSTNAITVTNQPQIDVELFDSAGNPVGTSDFPISGPVPNPQWVVIPGEAYIGFRIDMQTVGIPTREQGTLLAVGGKSWGLSPGKYLLKTEAAFQKEINAPPNQWVGELALPPVEFEVN